MSAERRVGRDDDDAASRWSLAPRRGLLEQATDRDSVNPQLLRGAEVRQREHADRRAADDTARGADPALPAEADHARAGAHGPFFDVLARLAGRIRRPRESVEAAGDDRRHPRRRDAAAAGWVRFVSADGDVSDRYALDVGDRVPWPGFELADPQSLVAQPLGRHAGTVPGLRPGERTVRAPEGGESFARHFQVRKTWVITTRI